MAMRQQVVFGAEEIVANLHAVVGTLRRSAIRNAMRAAATLIRDDARRRASVRTGALKKSIIATTARVKKNPGIIPDIGIVKIDKKAFTINAKGKLKSVDRRAQRGGRGRRYQRGDIYPRNYDHLVEFGTKPHMAGPRMHPGAKPKPFMRAAFFATHAAALEMFRQRLHAEAFKDVVKNIRRRA